MEAQAVGGHAEEQGVSASMRGTIICAVGGADGVEAAVDVASRLGARFDARIVLVTVEHGARAATENGAVDSRRRARARAARQLGRVVVEYDLSDLEHRVAAGDPAEAVALIAAEEAADLIIVGARRGLLGGGLRSSFAGELAATASCPVVVAPPEGAQPAVQVPPPARRLGPGE